IVTGKLNNGCIVVNTGEDAQKVTLVLEGAEISCADGAAIRCEQAKKLTIKLAPETENILSSGSGNRGVAVSMPIYEY
ncbi:MAG: carbohydrate-binding domain-containing protein, partial [Clostridia bacterium]|nr:carbohydrate-binding domain-containing protein [Clostridia bacterium]